MLSSPATQIQISNFLSREAPEPSYPSLRSLGLVKFSWKFCWMSRQSAIWIITFCRKEIWLANVSRKVSWRQFISLPAFLDCDERGRTRQLISLFSFPNFPLWDSLVRRTSSSRLPSNTFRPAIKKKIKQCVQYSSCWPSSCLLLNPLISTPAWIPAESVW